jgi:hypothetical protein
MQFLHLASTAIPYIVACKVIRILYAHKRKVASKNCAVYGAFAPNKSGIVSKGKNNTSFATFLWIVCQAWIFGKAEY